MTKHQRFLISTVITKGKKQCEFTHGEYKITHYLYENDLYSVLTFNDLPMDIISL